MYENFSLLHSVTPTREVVQSSVMLAVAMFSDRHYRNRPTNRPQSVSVVAYL